ncbi:agmatinase [Thermoanaerobacterium thermosaccharolyticum]|uniref:Agmatinase n=2 Tax=Thermoanaerobacterium thermosaccharolyticum TaxID=1517 RepID=D9TT99_THETC|nr:agmatinase [Thermoanaerobacterium thermosaccharolyticum]TCW37213.1 agmatinase [Thermohydrogenium kirishiense]ADL68865.1 agmatinase [Thermoanaerobacterium thermosaccharolyticum DSM 571]AGB18958.1 agmatinase [Thermoanaerobacterium thermosaccharolyticum M0795]KAA5807675.1 agmatinase [Thermoanaerobacterium thermosaccharolyticum]MCP2239264.1 agmatinase [Thermoanaerobacterium thermosaccharolyticum]
MVIKDNFSNSGKFLSSINDYKESDIVIVGVPMDYTVSFKPGTRFGPQAIRTASLGLEEYSVYLDRNLKEKKYYDFGDLILPYGNVEKSLDIIGNAAKEILEDGKKPLFLGGEHLISAPVIKEVYKKYGDELVVLHFDAHTDLRTEFFGEENSHATVLRKASEFINNKNMYHFGIRSGIKEEFEFSYKNTNMFLFNVVEPLKSVLEYIKSKPIYITWDIDVLDPAYAPGTGTPEPGGITSKEAFNAIHILKDLNVVGMDLVEVSPDYDHSGITSILAAKLIRESILSFL